MIIGINTEVNYHGGGGHDYIVNRLDSIQKGEEHLTKYLDHNTERKSRSWAGYGDNIKAKGGVFTQKGRRLNRQTVLKLEVHSNSGIGKDGTESKERSTNPSGSSTKQNLDMVIMSPYRRKWQTGDKEGTQDIIKLLGSARGAVPIATLQNKQYVYSLYGRGKGKQIKYFPYIEMDKGTNLGVKNDWKPTFQHMTMKGNKGHSILLSDIKGCDKNGHMVKRKCMHQMEAKIKKNMAEQKTKRGESKSQSTLDKWTGKETSSKHTCDVHSVGEGVQLHKTSHRK